MTIELSNDIFDLCNTFSKKSVDTNIDEYFKRNQDNIFKIQKDILIGKLGEWGVYLYLKNKGLDKLNEPDLKIYQRKFKSFDCDLKNEKFKFHIKSQSIDSSVTFGTSWMFEKKDPVVNNPSDYDFFFGTTVNQNEKKVNILLFKKVKDLKFDKPFLSKLSTKVCVYLEQNKK